MTPARAKQLLPIIQAFAEGRPIQGKARNTTEYVNVPLPTWSDNYDYRIAPRSYYGFFYGDSENRTLLTHTSKNYLHSYAQDTTNFPNPSIIFEIHEP